MKQTLKIGFTVLVVAALTMSGIALAQSDETATDDAPAAEDVSRAVDGILERLAPLVEDGTITQDQAQAVADQLADGFGKHRPGPRRGIAGLDTAAEVLGMDVEELASQLRDGSTLAEIAGGQADEVIAAMVAQAEERLAQAVEDGKLTQDEADEKLAEAEERITTFVNEGPPERPEGEGPGGRPGHRPGGPGGPEGEADGATLDL
ncbi:MAG: hypothetical protein KQH83_08185 [Actinobacteria bacterium]|nr:hypothetical protein [Actinomycetota bacterium]